MAFVRQQLIQENNMANEQCKHGIRAPHECRQCEAEPSDAEIQAWTASQGLAASEPAGAESPAQRQIVAYEFYNPATGHAIVDYSEHTHVGHLTKEKGYVKRALVYATDIEVIAALWRKNAPNSGMDLS
jgi:hypothetical protein